MTGRGTDFSDVLGWVFWILLLILAFKCNGVSLL